jgi:threonyl-tRNA synthetase
MLIIGEDEVENGTVSIRARNGDQRNGVLLKDFIEGIVEEIKSRSPSMSMV